MRIVLTAMLLLVTLQVGPLTRVCYSTQDMSGGQIGTHTPEKGSVERKSILDALRVPIEKQLKQSVVFKIDHFKVQSGWAFLMAVPQSSDGGSIDYHGAPYQDAVADGAFDDSVIALLHNVNGKWKVVQYVIGATDVPYLDWDKKYRAPKKIFEQ